MFAAGTNKNPEVITTLLKAGADIKARSTTGQYPADDGPPGTTRTPR